MLQRPTALGFALLLALLAALQVASSAQAASGSRKCRRECHDRIAACVTAGGHRRPCRRSMVERCRREGVAVCQGQGGATATSTSTPITTSTTTTTLTGGGFLSALVTDPAVALTEPETPRPAYEQPVSPAVFHVPIVRIANDPGLPTLPVHGTWGSDARHVYSKQQPWNADETLISIENRGAGASPAVLILDSATYQPKYAPCDNYDLWDYRWHPSRAHAHEQINVDPSGTELMWFDVVSCTKTRSWSLPIAADYGIGSGEGNPSNDGRFVMINGKRRIYVVDMDPKPPFAPYPNQRIGPALDISSCGVSSCTLDWASVSASGKYGVVSYSGDNERVFDIDPVTLALTPHAMPTSSYRCHGTAAAGFTYSLGHADFALDPLDDHEDALVGQDECHLTGQTIAGTVISHVMMVRLRDGKITGLTDPSNEAYAHHISTRSINRPGWAYVDYFQEDGKRFSDEVIAVKLDGSKAVT